jgi:hypothetical protein
VTFFSRIRGLSASIVLGSMAAAALAATPARADMVLYDSATLIQGDGGSTETFQVTTPGTLTVTLSNIPWLDVVSNLNYFLSNSSGTIGSMMSGFGTEQIALTPGTYYAHWFGDAQGTFNEGVLGINIQYQPSVTPVPLPASWILMVGGLVLLFGWQQRQPEGAR